MGKNYQSSSSSRFSLRIRTHAAAANATNPAVLTAATSPKLNGGSSSSPEPGVSVGVSLVGEPGRVVEDEFGGAVIEVADPKVTVVGGASVVVLSANVVLGGMGVDEGVTGDR